jgi:hypothetical protein
LRGNASRQEEERYSSGCSNRLHRAARAAAAGRRSGSSKPVPATAPGPPCKQPNSAASTHAGTTLPCRRFADGFPNLFVKDAIRIRNRHVAFLASFHTPGGWVGGWVGAGAALPGRWCVAAQPRRYCVSFAVVWCSGRGTGALRQAGRPFAHTASPAACHPLPLHLAFLPRRAFLPQA